MKNWIKWINTFIVLIFFVSVAAFLIFNSGKLFFWSKIGLAVSFVYLFVFAIVSFILTRLKGNIVIKIDKIGYKRGERIHGKLFLKLKKPIAASGLSLRLVAVNAKIDGKGGVNTFDAPELFSSEIKLGDKKEYQSQVYDFEFEIPKNAPINQNNFSISVNGLPVFGSNRRVVWSIEAKLDEPESDLDITGRHVIEIYQ